MKMFILQCQSESKSKQVYRRRYESRRSSKPKLHLKKQKNKIWRKTIFNMADGILTLLHPAMWHVALGS